MIKRWTHSVLAVLLALITILAPLPVYAEVNAPLWDMTMISNLPKAPSVAAPSAILVEAKTGAILYAKDADTPYFPASITKIMTALLTIENCSLDETVTFSYRATHELEAGSSSIARTEGERLSVKDCLYAMLIASANEVAQALAEHVSGSIEAFAELMNQRAKELGCTNTNFTNPSGLNDPSHQTTAHDMALIMRAAIQNPDYLEINSTTSYSLPATNKNPQSLAISMKHKLLASGDLHYDYAIAGKTGFTQLAGYTLVTYAVKDNLDLICVVMGGQASTDHYSTTRALFDYGFDNYTIYNVSESDTEYNLNNSMLEDNSFLGSNILSLSVSDDDWILLPNSVPFSALNTEFAWGDSASGPNTLATVTYSYGGHQVGQANLTVKRDEGDVFSFSTTKASEEDAEDRSGSGQSESSWFSWKWVVLAAAIILIILLILFLWPWIQRKRRRRTYRNSWVYRKKRRKKIKMRLSKKRRKGRFL